MSRDVLDLIDAALDDYATSCDAMHWAPDAPDPTPPRPPAEPVTIRLIYRLTPDGMVLALDGRHLREQLRLRYRRRYVGRVMRRLRTALNPPPSPLAAAVVERRARLRRMHSEYHRRTRHRRTR